MPFLSSAARATTDRARLKSGSAIVCEEIGGDGVKRREDVKHVYSYRPSGGVSVGDVWSGIIPECWMVGK